MAKKADLTVLLQVDASGLLYNILEIHKTYDVADEVSAEVIHAFTEALENAPTKPAPKLSIHPNQTTLEQQVAEAESAESPDST